MPRLSAKPSECRTDITISDIEKSRREARKLIPPGPCAECGVLKKRYNVHHKDGDPMNNDPGNLERRCNRCHGLTHRVVGQTPKPILPGELIRTFVNSARRSRLDYNGLVYLFKVVRKELGIERPRRGRVLPHILADNQLKRFYDAIQQSGNVMHELMLKLLFYTGLRVSELVNIQISDVDLEASKIYIQYGKGGKDRYVLFPETFRLTLRTYLRSIPDNKYLFESSRKTKYTPRSVQRFVAHYADKAEIPTHVHPHLLRHQLLTWLTSQGLTDAEIQVISGHSSKASLEVYQHLSLKDTAPGIRKR